MAGLGPLGQRGYYGYGSDTNQNYQFLTRLVDGLAIGNVGVAAGAQGAIPPRLVPRHLWLVNLIDGSRRKLICGDRENPFYLGGGNVVIDGITWKITGRVGEKDKGVVTD